MYQFWDQQTQKRKIIVKEEQNKLQSLGHRVHLFATTVDHKFKFRRCDNWARTTYNLYRYEEDPLWSLGCLIQRANLYPWKLVWIHLTNDLFRKLLCLVRLGIWSMLCNLWERNYDQVNYLKKTASLKHFTLISKKHGKHFYDEEYKLTI